MDDDDPILIDLSGFIKDITPMAPEELRALESSLDRCESFAITGVWGGHSCPLCGMNFNMPENTPWPMITPDGSDVGIAVCETCGVKLAASVRE